MRRHWLALMLLAFSAQAMAVERVVSLAPSLSEIVVELGAADLLVCVLDGGERPAALATLPNVDPEDAPEARVFFQGVDVEHAKVHAARPLPEVFARKGSYRDVMMPVAVTLASMLTWFAVGDPGAVQQLLDPVRAIGRRRAR